MALGGAGLFKQTTMLEQLLEEINFQRTKEMRQLMKDDSGFVVLQGTTYWTDLFVRHFLFQEDKSIDCDDLLFFVRKRHVRGSSRHLPKYETEVEVFRKDSKKLPIGDPEVDWEETVYLNLVVHQFEYTLTLAVCTRTSPKQLQVLRRASHAVYASPSRRKMDSKGEGEEMTYPHICFMVDNFDEVFSDMVVRDGEMVCVELAARGRGCSAVAVIFLGSIRYDALVNVYESRQTSLSTKVAQRMSFGLLGKGAARCEFVRMKGPNGKGHAEMAVSVPRGSGLDTPTSEPAADNDWDDDWDDDNNYFTNYSRQRRLSDPSANLVQYVRGGVGGVGGMGGGMSHSVSGVSGLSGGRLSELSRSADAGLESLVPGIPEIDAGDVRDDVPASSTPLGSKRCEIAEDAVSLDNGQFTCDRQRRETVSCSERITVRGKEELPIYSVESEEDNGNEGDDESERDGDTARYNGPPKRTTDDGTVIYYWCDMPKRKGSELDDGIFHPLQWRGGGGRGGGGGGGGGRGARGRRAGAAGGAPLTAELTYVTLPWWSIAKDILDHREQPILTF